MEQDKLVFRNKSGEIEFDWFATELPKDNNEFDNIYMDAIRYAEKIGQVEIVFGCKQGYYITKFRHGKRWSEPQKIEVYEYK